MLFAIFIGLVSWEHHGLRVLLLASILIVWLVWGVAGGLSIRDAWGSGILSGLRLVGVVDGLSISIVVVSRDHWLSQGDISGIGSTDNNQLLCWGGNRGSVVDNIGLVVVEMLISEESIVSLLSACSDTAWNESDQDEDAPNYNSCDLATIGSGIIIVAVVSAIVAIGTIGSLQFRLLRLLSSSLRDLFSSS